MLRGCEFSLAVLWGVHKIADDARNLRSAPGPGTGGVGRGLLENYWFEAC